MDDRPEGTGVPLICIPFLFTRVDSTPPNERELFPHNTVDRNGEPIPEPHKRAAAEYVIIPGPEIPAPIVVVKSYDRTGGSRQQVQQRLLWDHADVVGSKPDTRRYVARYAVMVNIGPTDSNFAQAAARARSTLVEAGSAGGGEVLAPVPRTGTALVGDHESRS